MQRLQHLETPEGHLPGEVITGEPRAQARVAPEVRAEGAAHVNAEDEDLGEPLALYA